MSGQWAASCRPATRAWPAGFLRTTRTWGTEGQLGQMLAVIAGSDLPKNVEYPWVQRLSRRAVSQKLPRQVAHLPVVGVEAFTPTTGTIGPGKATVVRQDGVRSLAPSARINIGLHSASVAEDSALSVCPRCTA